MTQKSWRASWSALCVAFHSSQLEKRSAMCLAAACHLQQQSIPGERALVFEGPAIDSEACSEIASDEASMFWPACFCLAVKRSRS